MIIDMHVHSQASDDSRASVEAYLKWITTKKAERPIDGIVLTEHRQFNAQADYRHLEEKYGILILKGSEVETDYGHVLVYGVNSHILRRFDFRNIHLNAQELITEVERMGGIALPCHPGRPTIGLCEHYQKKPRLQGVVAVEVLNGGSRKDENERAEDLLRRCQYRGFGGSDAHLVSFVGVCATEFDGTISTAAELVKELKNGRYRPVDFRPGLVGKKAEHGCRV